MLPTLHYQGKFKFCPMTTLFHGCPSNLKALRDLGRVSHAHASSIESIENWVKTLILRIIKGIAKRQKERERERVRKGFIGSGKGNKIKVTMCERQLKRGATRWLVPTHTHTHTHLGIQPCGKVAKSFSLFGMFFFWGGWDCCVACTTHF